MSLVILVGKLTHDPELKYTCPAGIPFIRMPIAVHRKAKPAEEASKDEVVHVDVLVWRRLAELCAQFLKKGRTVMVVGSIRKGLHDGGRRNGRPRLTVVADRVQFLGPRDLSARPADENPHSKEPGGA